MIDITRDEKIFLKRYCQEEIDKSSKRAKNDIQKIIDFYREILGDDCSAKERDDLYYKTDGNTKYTKILLKSLNNNIELCYLAIVTTKREQKQKNLEWKLSTVIKLLPNWIGKREKYLKFEIENQPVVIDKEELTEEDLNDIKEHTEKFRRGLKEAKK